MDKFTGLGTGGLALLFIALSAFYSCFVWHKIMIFRGTMQLACLLLYAMSMA
jgi:hypothetical protein